MKIFIAQIKSICGDILGNFKRIQASYNQANETKCDICLLPELVTSGYLAEDLFLNPDFIKEIFKINKKLIQETKKCTLILPTIVLIRHKLYNSAIVAQNGSVIGKTYKSLLPNYGLFDEKRYFTTGIPKVITVNNYKIGIPICEDIWSPQICATLKTQGTDIFLVPNASPYEIGKLELRLQQVIDRYDETNIPFVYCNQAHAQDGIIFDGNSFCYDGTLSMICKGFCEDNSIVAFNNQNKKKITISVSKKTIFSTNLVQERFNSLIKKDNQLQMNLLLASKVTPLHAKIRENVLTLMPAYYAKEVYHALVFGLKSYVENNNFTKVILGVSGGIDSALVASICRDALGSENVMGYMLPTSITSCESKDDAKELSKLLNIKLKKVSIIKILEQYIRTMNANKSAKEQDLVYQNLQARIRGSLLMAFSNKSNSLLVTTGNKSEYATGYSTLYGDMNGAFNPIKDLYKTQVIALANYRNSISYVIPANIITKSPSAELASHQKDSDFLLEYELLDRILYYYIEHNLSRLELYKKFKIIAVDKVIKLVRNSEFKRKQSAPGIKISKRNFEKDRRFPITNLFPMIT